MWDKDIEDMALQIIYFRYEGEEGYRAVRDMIIDRVYDFEAHHIVLELVFRRVRELTETHKQKGT